MVDDKEVELNIVMLGNSELNTDSVLELISDSKVESDGFVLVLRGIPLEPDKPCVLDTTDSGSVLDIWDPEAENVVSKAILVLVLPDATLLMGGIPVPDSPADESDSIVEGDPDDNVLEGKLPEDSFSSNLV